MKKDGECMERFREILLAVWREACRHIEIGESTATIARMLLPHMPLAYILVQRIDHVKGFLETVAAGPSDPSPPWAEARRTCSPEEMRQLVAWCHGGAVSHRHGPNPPDEVMPLLCAPDTASDALVGPLMCEGEPAGLLTLVGRPGESFRTRHAEMARILLEPFSAALENDLRLRETETLREAAEADKQSLLHRLGRKDLGDVVIGADSGLRAVLERAALVSVSDVPVLIFGETGTGKELIARVIHKRSPRAPGPIIRVNCGAIPPELIDSQLFGHERGAFTGAVETRHGWFERADGGTLFLDEIGELPLAAQVRLLRILQDGWFERIGGAKSIHVDVRIIAATHCDLAGMVTAGRFREDLWYRIAVFPILLPPLRERVQDIPVLARHFAERAALRYGLPVLMPSEEDIALLTAYPWPGNVRELGTVMDRAAIIGNGRRLEVAKALGVLGPAAAPALPRTETPEPNGAAPPFLSLEEAMRQHIEKALTLTDGRVEGPRGAAALLKINPHTLRARMRKLGISWNRFREHPTEPS